MSLAAILERAGLRPQRPQPSPSSGDAQTRMDKGVPHVPKIPSQKNKGACKPKNVEAWHEDFEERAAILEFDAGHPRAEAERLASEMTAEREMRRLLAAAMRACDHWHDSEAAQHEMARQCQAVPPHLREELRQHFERSYPPEASQ